MKDTHDRGRHININTPHRFHGRSTPGTTTKCGHRARQASRSSTTGSNAKPRTLPACSSGHNSYNNNSSTRPAPTRHGRRKSCPRPSPSLTLPLTPRAQRHRSTATPPKETKTTTRGCPPDLPCPRHDNARPTPRLCPHLRCPLPSGQVPLRVLRPRGSGHESRQGQRLRDPFPGWTGAGARKAWGPQLGGVVRQDTRARSGDRDDPRYDTEPGNPEAFEPAPPACTLPPDRLPSPPPDPDAPSSLLPTALLACHVTCTWHGVAVAMVHFKVLARSQHPP